MQRLVQFLKKEHFTCEMCGKKAYSNKYRRKATQFISDYIPPTLILCKTCVYKERK